MKKLFLKLNIFIFILVGLYLMIYSFVLRDHRQLNNLKINQQILFFGHSHSASAYNDSIIFNSKNLSEGGESYFFTYFKLKSILDHNSNKIVFIEFTNNQLDTSMNRWTYKDPYLSDKYPRYASMIPMSEHVNLFIRSPLSFCNSMFFSMQKNLAHINENKFNLLATYGGFSPRDTSLLNHKNLFKDEIITNDHISKVSINYLKKIILYLKERKMKFYLIRSPLHKSSYFWNFESKYQELLKKEFSDVPFLDFASYDLEDDSFYDNEHLNRKGAFIYSQHIDSVIKNTYIF